MPDNPGDYLNNLVGSLGYSYGAEKSIKFTNSRLIADRLLLSIHKSALGTDPAGKLEKILSKMGFPNSNFPRLFDSLNAADIVHFGYEGYDQRYIYKCYLEFTRDYKKSREHGLPGQKLVHIAFKWDPADDRISRTSFYHSYATTTVDLVENLLRQVYRDHNESMVCAMVRDLVSSLMAAKTGEELMLMAVTEEGNERLSFDLNLYDAEIKLCFLEKQMTQIADYFRVAKSKWIDYFNLARDEDLGHLAGGVDGNGNEFFTAYYGVEERAP